MDIIDYVKAFGDKTFFQVPFGEVDALVLVQLSYLDYSGLVTTEAKPTARGAVTLKELSYNFQNSDDFESRRDLGLLINKATVDLLFLAGASCRYGSVKAFFYRQRLSSVAAEQFCAVSFLLEKNLIFAAFRGTDDTLAGWKEDFLLATGRPVKAQLDCQEYLTALLKATRSPVILGGHSKGGNLAIYSALGRSVANRKRLLAIFNMDGPGFSFSTVNSHEFSAIKKLIKNIFPSGSVIGAMFCHAGEALIVKSSNKGLMQHDPFSWEVERGEKAKIIENDKAGGTTSDETKSATSNIVKSITSNIAKSITGDVTKSITSNEAKNTTSDKVKGIIGNGEKGITRGETEGIISNWAKGSTEGELKSAICNKLKSIAEDETEDLTSNKAKDFANKKTTTSPGSFLFNDAISIPAFLDSQSKKIFDTGAAATNFPKLVLPGEELVGEDEVRMIEAHFVTEPTFLKSTIIFHETFNEWIENCSSEALGTFVDTLFSVIEASGAKTNSELKANALHSVISITSAASKIDKASQKVLWSVLTALQAPIKDAIALSLKK